MRTIFPLELNWVERSYKQLKMDYCKVGHFKDFLSKGNVSHFLENPVLASRLSPMRVGKDNGMHIAYIFNMRDVQ